MPSLRLAFTAREKKSLFLGSWVSLPSRGHSRKLLMIVKHFENMKPNIHLKCVKLDEVLKHQKYSRANILNKEYYPSVVFFFLILRAFYNDLLRTTPGSL